jgi:hypothetical protein
MSYQLKVIKDNPVGFWALDEISGTLALDTSGCGNDGTYSGGITNGLLPLIPGGLQGSLITNSKSISFPIVNNYYGDSSYASLADINSLDNDCSFEVWFYPKFITTNETVILGNSTDSIGLFYDSGDIVFKFGQYTARHTLAHISKSHYIVGTYSPSEIKLYVDGDIKSTVPITDLPSLSQSGLTLNVGPTLSASDSFIVDAPAVYRHALPISKIFNHYSEIQPIPAHQIAFPDQGRIFESYDNNISTSYSYSYPGNKPWNYFKTDGTYYNAEEQYISITQTDTADPASVQIDDFISIPSGIGANSSKIEWDYSNGISVSVSIDGVSYTPCINGGEIPGFTRSSFSLETGIHIRITLSTSDSSKYIPRLYTLSLNFYKDQTLFASNSSDYISALETNSYTLGNKVYPILSRDSRNGVKVFDGSGFIVNTQKQTYAIEFFYTPSALSNSGLVSSISGSGSASNYSWVTNGTISKTNISSIYVNGINKTSETSISNVFTPGETYHVVILYTSGVSGSLRFNSSDAGSVAALYQNIALYPLGFPVMFDSAKASEHYALYTQRSISVADDSSVTLTESGTSVYNNDWLVIQNI